MHSTWIEVTPVGIVQLLAPVVVTMCLSTPVVCDDTDPEDVSEAVLFVYDLGVPARAPADDMGETIFASILNELTDVFEEDDIDGRGNAQ